MKADIKSYIAAFILLCFTPISIDAQINLIVASDIGRNGAYQQKPIAALMGKVAETTDIEAILALGDTHHYMGIESIDDPLWMTNYELIYNHPELQIPWYPILGNHEYRGNTQAVIEYSNRSRRWQMPSRYYSKVFEGDSTTLRVVFIDTTPLIDKYHSDAADYPSVTTQDINAQLAWLEKELLEAQEDWVIVVGHHPIYADTPKSESERYDMQRRVDPILRRYKVSMYICGHIHNFQHIRFPGDKIDYIVNTSGSLSRESVNMVEGSKFVSGQSGFSILSCTHDKLQLDMLNDKGEVIHSVVQTRQ